MTLMLVPKNLWKSRASVDSNLTQQDARFWMSRAMSAKLGSSSLGSIESMDDSSEKLLGVVLVFVAVSGAEEGRGRGEGGIWVVCCGVCCRWREASCG
jgi:hypothetical protein